MDNNQVDITNNLLGLGNVTAVIKDSANKMGVPATPELIRVAKSVAAKSAKLVAHNKNLTRGQAIFAQKVGELSEQSVKDLRSGNAQLVDGERYIAASVSTGAGTQELLRNAPDAAVGITNFENGRMPSGVNMLLEAVKVEVANSAGAATADIVEYNNIFDAGGLAVAYQNGELEIVADGRVIMPSTPMAKFFAVGGTGMVDKDGAVVFKLKAPKMIPAGSKVEINWRKPTNAVVASYPANNNFIKATLIGSETTTR